MTLIAAVDVGTASARAGLFDVRGALVARAERPIAIRRPAPGFVEHDAEDIWAAVAAAVRAARREAGAASGAVAGIGFDATCSLVVRDGAWRPVGASDEDCWDTISWMDHRAGAEAAECTASGHRVLDHAGGVMSPEMQLPKLMWLKRHRPEAWARAGHLFDLADFLSWRASGSLARSNCTLTCKWSYLGHERPGWPADFLAARGLADLAVRGALPAEPVPVGSPVGRLTPEAAEVLGLGEGCRVAAGLVDAHAGALGLIGGLAGEPAALERRIALIAGTSSCLMALGRRPRSLAGLWGPYWGAVLPGLWMNEGGQSASGALLDHLVAMHPEGGEPTPALRARLLARVSELRAAEGRDLAGRLHVLPDFHGNRSPLADPGALGVISGLGLDRSFDGLARLYWRAAVALALGLRHVLDHMAEAGWPVEALHLGGGHAGNPLLVELYADATGRPVVLPETPDAVLLGAAMLGAAAAGLYPDLAAAARGMAPPARVRRPDPAAEARFGRDYRVFLEMQRQRRALDRLLVEEAAERPHADAVQQAVI